MHTMTIEYVSATNLKRNTGEYLNKVRYGGVRLIVERNGEPLVEITPLILEKSKNEVFEKYFGVYSKEKGKKVKKEMDKFRKDFQLLK